MVYVRAAGLVDPEQLLDRVLENYDGLDDDESEGRAARSSGTSSALAALAERQRDQPMVVLLDDIDPVVGNIVFGVLRDELWETRTTWVVTATREGSTSILAPPADAFFETILRMDPLPEAEAIDLLRRRLHRPDQARLETIARHGGQPRELLELARQVDWDSTAPGVDLDAHVDSGTERWVTLDARPRCSSPRCATSARSAPRTSDCNDGWAGPDRVPCRFWPSSSRRVWRHPQALAKPAPVGRRRSTCSSLFSSGLPGSVERVRSESAASCSAPGRARFRRGTPSVIDAQPARSI